MSEASTVLIKGSRDSTLTFTCGPADTDADEGILASLFTVTELDDDDVAVKETSVRDVAEYNLLAGRTEENARVDNFLGTVLLRDPHLRLHAPTIRQASAGTSGQPRMASEASAWSFTLRSSWTALGANIVAEDMQCLSTTMANFKQRLIAIRQWYRIRRSTEVLTVFQISKPSSSSNFSKIGEPFAQGAYDYWLIEVRECSWISASYDRDWLGDSF